MAEQSAIEWTDSTWNPVTGCTKLSAGCDRCYAERWSERFRGVKGHPFESGFDLKLRPTRVDQPLSWRRPRRIFVNSMSDLFHKRIPSDFIGEVFSTMECADWHIFQVLTKRSSIMRRFVNRRYPDSLAPRHVWLGVSVEDRRSLSRLKHLRESNASVRFVSFEPLLEDLGEIELSGFHWVIVGGESGPGARPMNADWVRSLQRQCEKYNVAFFFKQWGGVNKKRTGRELDGRTWDAMPSGF